MFLQIILVIGLLKETLRGVKMTNRTINDEIVDIVTHEIKNIAFMTDCTFTKKYVDNYADIESNVYGSIRYVKVIGDYEEGDKGILLFLNNDLSNRIALAEFNNGDIDDLIIEINNLKAGKVDKVEGKSLSTNDFTDTLKSKLENIEERANRIIVDSSLSNTSTNPLQNKAIDSAINNKVDKVSGKGLSTNDFTDDLKTKLDEIEAKANKIIVDNALSSTSTNPVQNKVINTALNGKASTAHTHNYSDVKYDYVDISGTNNTVGYIDAIKITINATYQDKPIVIKTQHRDKIERSVIQIKFQNANNNDPGLTSITHTGQDMPFYLYKQSSSNWILITGKGNVGDLV